MTTQAQAKLVKECAKGWSSCKRELQSQYQHATDRRANLRKLAESYDLPADVGDQMDDCLNGNNEQCAKAAATIAAVAACNAASGGACPKCCAILSGPVISTIWPIVGPTLTAIAEGFTSLLSVGLEWLGIKDSPDFASDVYWPMRNKAEAEWNAMRTKWLQKFPNGAAVLDEELNRSWQELQVTGFKTATWYPTNYGNISLPANIAPFGVKWDLEWDRAWERDDAFEAGADAIAKMYAVRLGAGIQAIARATGRLMEQPKLNLAGRLKLVQRTPPRAAGIAAAAAGTVACGIVGGTWYFLLRR